MANSGKFPAIRPRDVLSRDLRPVRVRNCSAYTLRAYAIGLAHFFSWLHDASESLEHVTRQIISRYITDFSQGERQVR